ncbi:TPA: aminomethyl-transferring glycine dehydrogenase subunit GcvPA [Candidatus Scatousia excrementigallinarum]|uniref:Aminomethyl-transferring glycine dehydrogenase subunit GcvPA n=1 Tax=Candidatus Scatousia excrementigallinarum TaxID=2840935 RepID=A0A9D1JMC2_9BACT|nr:aminomethyl-transferring glycine dehydrogenase subunit GcvPA [Candidatus Scatousia excrementigallinarum]
MKNFLVHDENTRAEMLESIGLKQIEDLFAQIPNAAKLNGLELENPLSEMETQRKIKSLSRKNNTDYISFLGGGVYNKFIPAAIAQVANRFEFLTAYTPYQAEIAQGTLQIMYEFQTMIARLTGMDIANATVYDGATACAEAILMAARIKKCSRVLVSNKLNPEFLDVIKTYTWANDIEVTLFDEIPTETSGYACVLVQNPDFYGEIRELKEVDTLLIVCTDVSALSILKPPVEADIVVADIQTLGMPLSFGGPHAGVIACKEKYMRQMPGRLAGRTIDKDGNQAFTLTIQTREQHIKREKATSNICSNQALMGLWANLYLSLLGEKGFRQAGYLSAKNAHKLSQKLADHGIKTLNNNFFNEFVIEVDGSDKFLTKLKDNNIIGGLKLDDTKILVAATEMNTDEEIDLYLKSLS